MRTKRDDEFLGNAANGVVEGQHMPHNICMMYLWHRDLERDSESHVCTMLGKNLSTFQAFGLVRIRSEVFVFRIGRL